MGGKWQVTLALLKPDIAVNPLAVKAVKDRIISKNLSVMVETILNWTRKDSKLFYKQHQGKFFYKRLVEYTTCGPVVALALEGRNAIQEWRNIMGPTKTFQAVLSHPNSIRGEFGLSDTRNSTHGSDSEKSASKEIEAIFGIKQCAGPNLFPFSKVEENTLVVLPNTSELRLTIDHSLMKFVNEHHIVPTELSNLPLGLPQTWETLYRTDGECVCTEWFFEYGDIEEEILPVITKATQALYDTGQKQSVLYVGCGTSMFGPNLAKDLGSDVDVYCIDFVSEALHKLRRYMDNEEDFRNVRNCFFVKSDVTEQLPFQENTVSAIVDKGMIDSILKQENGCDEASVAIANIASALCRGGVFLQITDEPPETRIDLLQNAVGGPQCPFSVSCRQMLSDTNHFLYTVSKL